ncbi:MAG: hypothetical protein HFF56_05275 [Lawsonibacter sp.]|nr:hypothetical protein [Lawsonibacter sp.]
MGEHMGIRSGNVQALENALDCGKILRKKLFGDMPLCPLDKPLRLLEMQSAQPKFDNDIL